MILRFGGVIGFSGCVTVEVFIINKYYGALILVFKGGGLCLLKRMDLFSLYV